MKCTHNDCFTCPYSDCIANDPREMRGKKTDRYEYLKNCELEQMAYFLCNIIDNISTDKANNCDICPATDYCHQGHNGFIDWLKVKGGMPWGK